MAGSPLAAAATSPALAQLLNLALPDFWFLNFYPSSDIR